MVPSHPYSRTAVLTTTMAVLLALTACSGSAVSDSAGDTEAPLKIGVVLPLTGPVSDTGKALQRGFELGVRKVNDSGGVNGKKVEYVVVDDAGDPATSTQLARRLIQQDHASMLFGTITGDTAEAVSKVADDAKVPFGTAILGDTERCFPYSWGFGESTRQILLPSVPEMIRTYGKRVAITGSDYNYPHFYAGIVKELTRSAGGTIVAEEYSPLGQTDWQAVITRLKDTKPDVLLSMVVGADAVAFSQQAKQFGLFTTKLGYDGAPLDADYYPALGDLVNGRTHVVRWTDQLDNAESKKFVADYRAKNKWTPPVPEVAGNAYFGIQFFLAAAGKAGGNDPQAINTQIGQLRFDSPLGKGTRFEPANHLLRANMLETTIEPGGAYKVTRDLGPIADTVAKQGCS
ncbi:ABC transporter substrate-binding protein [Nonomuraea guangzhouensis]|uniref:ABC transporter substrate-binding protein n=1 Tax=Nonomuraea guangzhouensis TaxID=1291555 RepID=A0ABW4G2U6_9ACTN|nr:ABC transporter substrate-binding protein [Nonomuraea guangzhouensis]